MVTLDRFRIVRWLDHDFLPRISPYVDRWRTPLGVLILAGAASSLCGMFLHPQGFVLFFGLMAVILVGAVWPWLSVRGLVGELAFDSIRGRELEPLGARLILRNRCPWTSWGLTIRVGTDHDAALVAVGGWRSIDERFTLVADRRGEYPLVPARIASGFPFGFWESSRRLTVPRPVLVWPRTFPVGPVPIGAGDEAEVGASTSGRPGSFGDFAGVRPYRRGDSIRRVHWPQTARSGNLVVIDRHSESIPSIQIVLDIDPSGHRGSGGESSREWAIRIAASLVESWLGRARLEVVIGDQAISANDGGPARQRIFDALARIGADGLSLAATLNQTRCRTFRGGLRVVITTDIALDQTDLSGEPGRSVDRRYVVLRASQFDSATNSTSRPDPDVELRCRPWVVVDDPQRVAELVRAGMREVHHAV